MSGVRTQQLHTMASFLFLLLVCQFMNGNLMCIKLAMFQDAHWPVLKSKRNKLNKKLKKGS